MDSAEGKEFLQQLHKDKEKRPAICWPTCTRAGRAAGRRRTSHARAGYPGADRPHDQSLRPGQDAGRAGRRVPRSSASWARRFTWRRRAQDLMQIDDNVFVRGPVGRLEQLLTLQTGQPGRSQGGAGRGAGTGGRETSGDRRRQSAGLSPWERRARRGILQGVRRRNGKLRRRPAARLRRSIEEAASALRRAARRAGEARRRSAEADAGAVQGNAARRRCRSSRCFRRAASR